MNYVIRCIRNDNTFVNALFEDEDRGLVLIGARIGSGTQDVRALIAETLASASNNPNDDGRSG